MFVLNISMPANRFLRTTEYRQYANWLQERDTETLSLYFGVPVTDYFIDNLVQTFVDNSNNHYFLVAERNGIWLGTVHIAVVNETDVEFGVIVERAYRKQGIADQLMEEAILWARNRGYVHLFMQCLTWNRPVRHLAEKHGLGVKNFTNGTETESCCKLPPMDFTSIGQEYALKNRNLYRMILQSQEEMFANIYK
jgi:GNAT superfamily N-acetyltransferase